MKMNVIVTEISITVSVFCVSFCIFCMQLFFSYNKFYLIYQTLIVDRFNWYLKILILFFPFSSGRILDPAVTDNYFGKHRHRDDRIKNRATKDHHGMKLSSVQMDIRSIYICLEYAWSLGQRYAFYEKLMVMVQKFIFLPCTTHRPLPSDKRNPLSKLKATYILFRLRKTLTVMADKKFDKIIFVETFS